MAKLKMTGTLSKTLREHFESFCKYFWETIPGAGKVVWNWHMSYICQVMQEMAERVFEGLPRLHDTVINISPGSSKSSLCSILFPAWVWCRMPEARIMTASHTQSLVLDLSSKARTVLTSESYQELFPEIRIVKDTEGYYTNSYGGDRFSCTVGGKTPTGFHALFIVVDDPLDPQKALSEQELSIANNFVTSVIPTRKVNKEVAATFLIMQRLAVNDPAGTLLSLARNSDGVPIRHVCIPAELEDDKDRGRVSPPELVGRYKDSLMDPVRLPRRVLRSYRSTMGIYSYAGQFAQRPVPPGGQMFKPEYFNNRPKSAPFHSKRVRYYDRASTQGAGCYTAGVLMAKDIQGNIYVEDCVHGQWEPKERNDKILATAIRDRARYGPKNDPEIWIEREGGSSGRDSFRDIARVLHGFKVREHQINRLGDKQVRAEPWSAQCAALNVYLVDNGESKGLGVAEWDVNGYTEEHCLFPLFKIKDRVDASCLLGGTLVETLRGRVRIENVVAGDMVLTRSGYRKVKWSGCSGFTSRVVDLLFSDGSSLSGTPDHLIWSVTKGSWIRLDSVTGADIMYKSPVFYSGDDSCSLRSGLSWNKGNTSVSVGVVGQLLLNLIIDPMEFPSLLGDTVGRVREGGRERLSSLKGLPILGMLERVTSLGRGEKTHFTERCGNYTTVKSPLAIRSITLMGTSIIMKLRISNVSVLKSMLRGILEGELFQDSESTWIGLGRKLLSGMLRRREGSGIASMRSISGLSGRRGSIFVRSAKGCFCRSIRPNTVLPSAMIGTGMLLGRGGFMRRSACGAAINLWQIGRRPSTAVGLVYGDTLSSVPVYDIAVEGEHEFFANGVLVHNSGAYSVLSNMVLPGTVRVHRFSVSKSKRFRIFLCSTYELLTTVVEPNSLLVSIQDPRDFPKVPQNSIDKLIDSFILQFTEHQPADYQESWDDPVQPYDKPVRDLMLSTEQAKKLWAFVLKKRDPVGEVLVLHSDNNQVGQAMAFAISDMLRLSRQSTIYEHNKEEVLYNAMKASNEHIYETVKAARGLIAV